MKLINRIALGAGAAIASAALVVTPAMAATYNWESITVNSFDYSPENSVLFPDDISFGSYDDTLDDQDFQVTVDDFNDSDYVECENPQLNDATDGSGDKVVSCDEYDALGLTLKPELRIYANGQLVRFTADVTNSSATSIDVQWQYYIDIGSSDVVWNAENPAGTMTVDTDVDNWATAWGDDDEGAPVSYVWGGPNGAHRADAWEPDSGDEGYFWTDTAYELKPDHTVTYAFFTFVQTSAEANDETRTSLWEATTAMFGGPGGDIAPLSVDPSDPNYDTLLVGLDNCVVNWGVCTDPAPVLPDTGVSENAGIWAASAALIAALGVAGVFVARRRKA